MNKIVLVTVVMCALTIGAVASAQTPQVSGTVADPQGGVVANAEVSLIGLGAGVQSRMTRSGSDGQFAFERVSPGSYVLQIESSGFARWIQNLTVASEAITVSAALQIGGLTEDVTVTGVAPSTLSRSAPTGSRLGLTLLEIPASVQVVTGELMRERGDVAFTSAVTRAVGITSGYTLGSGGGSLNARGFSGTGSVMQLYDGVQMFVAASTVTFPFDTWTADRVEVLGGPASVLHGNGAIGGAINVVPRKPNPLSSEHTVRVIAGSNNTYRAALDTSGPITDRTSYRFDVSQNNSDGWIERGQSKSTVLSGSIRHDITPTLSISASEDLGYQRPMNYYGIPLIGGQINKSLRKVNYNLADANTSFTDNWSQAKVDWKPSSNLAVRSNVSFLSAERLWHRIGTFAYQPLTNMVNRTTVMEVFHHQRQVTGQTDVVVKGHLLGRDNTASIGLGYNWIRLDLLNNNPATGSSLVPLDNPSPGSFVDFARSPTIGMYLTHTHAAAVYGEDRLALNSRLSLVGGLRYDQTAVNRLDLPLQTISERTFRPVSGRGGVVVTVVPRLSVYGQYATATDAVGNLISQTAPQQKLDLSTGKQIEAGAKQSLFGGRGEWTLAGYRIVKTNLLVPDPNNPTLSLQIGQQSSRGVELSGMMMLGGGVRIEANGTVLRARFDDFAETVAGVVTSRVGKTPPNVAQRAGNLWATWDGGAGARWQVRSGLRYVGKRFSDNANTARMPSYLVVDAGARRRLTEKLALDVRVYNLLDKTYVLNLWNNPNQWLLGAPRSAELAVTASF